MNTDVITLSKFNPRKNFPAKSSQKRGESNFSISFIRFLKSQKHKNERKFVIGRELNLNGYGIADIILFEYSEKGEKILHTSLTTFEVKMRDWKKAIAQANRYKYYSNKVIVVLPIETSKPAVTNINIFRELQIGLWLFDKSDQKLLQYFTPRYSKIKHLQAYSKALSVLKNKFKFLQVV